MTSSGVRLAASMLVALNAASQPTASGHPAANPNYDLTTTEFFKDIGGNFKSLLSVRNVTPALVTGAAYGLATIPEQDLERHFAPGDVWGSWAAPGKYIGNPLVMGGLSATLFTVSRKSHDRRFRSFSYALLQGSIMSTALVQPMKVAFGRLRPSGEDHHAFPSGHSADTFMYATVAAEHYGWKAAVPAYALATYVSASRLPEQKHHLTDLVAGAGIGYIIGQTVSGRMRMKVPSNVSVSARRTERGFAVSVRIALP